MAKRKYIKIATPPVTASWSHLNKPDSGGEYSDDKYKITLFFEQDDPVVADLLRPAVDAAAQHEWPDGLPPTFHDPLEPIEESKREEEIGKIRITLKSNDQPLLTDAKGTPLPPHINIRAGDLVRVAGACAAYVSGKNKGVTFYLNAVRLIDKRAQEDPFGDAEKGFEVDDAFGGPEAAAGGSDGQRAASGSFDY